MKKAYEIHPHVFLSDWNNPNLNLVKGEGFYQWDADGTKYIDSCSGAMNASLGYGREDMAEVLKEQASKLGYLTRFTSVPSILDECSNILADFTGLDRFFLTSGGSEAVEMGVRIAKAYWFHQGQPTKNKIVSRWHSFHGNTFLTACYGGNIARKSDMSAYAIDEGHIAAPTCYNCPYDKEPDSCDYECANELETLMINSGSNNYAGFLFEPIGGTTTAAMLPPNGYFKRIQEICDAYELLVISDDVLAGYGRAGKPLSTDWFNIEPDVVALAKCMSGGYFPVGAAATNQRVSDVFKEAGYYHAGFTWAGNPIACAVVIETTRIMERENMIENINTQGEYLKDELTKMRESHPLMGDVRGKGLLIGVELVKDHETRTHLPNEQMALQKIMRTGYANGVILQAASGKMKRGIEGDAIILTPYYGVTREEVDELLEKLEIIFTQTEQQLDFG